MGSATVALEPGQPQPRQKLGLSLSGGGFRASLFHIGVLARLAELDRLRDVEVISTVSGGSILGAYYYLKLKQLLESGRSDFPHPTRDAYIAIVREVEAEFLDSVQKNLRMRALLNPIKDARMFLSDDFSRSDRMAELYNEYFYLPLWRRMNGGDATSDIPLHAIKIVPLGCTPGFKLSAYNDAADYKIPALVLNATTLNTGHAWHFTSSWVGEPAAGATGAPSIDANVTLAQLRFDGQDMRDRNVARPPLADAEHERKRLAVLQSLTLADAVAASACVPALFTPLPVHDLYWNSRGEPVVVELVDGGVFDNQGIDALYLAGCTDMVCSDAAGQLEDVLAPASRGIEVAMRANEIMMDRIRDDGFHTLYQRERGSRVLHEHDPQHAGNALEIEMRPQWNVARYAFFHLRESFSAQPGYPAFPGPADRSPNTTSGHVYRLSNLRTDLDSFSEIEAYSLMYDGYCLSNERLHASGISCDGNLPAVAGTDRWKFLQITTMLDPGNTPALARLLKHLHVGRESFFKAFRIPDLYAVAIALLIAAICGWMLKIYWDAQLPALPPIRLTVGAIATFIGIFLALAQLRKLASTAWLAKAIERLRWIRRGHLLIPLFLLLGALLTAVSIGVALHLLIFDRLFLRAGKMR